MNWLQLALVCVASTFVAAAIVLTRAWHGRWTGDPVTGGVQKHHHGAPPRIGLLPIGAATVLGWGLLLRTGDAYTSHLLGLMLLAAVPAVGLGLADDITKRIPPKLRMLGAAGSAVLGMWLLGAVVPRTGVPGLDALTHLLPVAVALTLLMVCGFVNAMNIVDGLNGLAAGLAILMLCATGALAWQLGDAPILQICGVLGAAIFGFFLLNFPRGITFLGDGGAYFIGFMLSQVWILLLVRHPEISPWFVMAVAAHPTVETVFSIYRRKIFRRREGAMKADRLHLHSLAYRRWALPLLDVRDSRQRWRANALASTVLVLMAGLPMALVMIWPDASAWGGFLLGAYVFVFMGVFSRLAVSGFRVRGERRLVRQQRVSQA